jgi:hypothetical protein
MNGKRIKERIFYGVAIGTSIVLLLFFILSVWIGFEAKNLCLQARWQYGGDCVSALMAQLDDTDEGFRNRNHAIWALGQIGDVRAMPTLRAHYTGIIPEREPLDAMISQYELKKAIAQMNGGINITRFIWMDFFSARE